MAFPACADRARIVLHHLPSGVSASMTSTIPAHVYEIRPRKDKRGVDLISDVLPFGRLWYGDPNAIPNAIGYAKFFSWSHNAVIRVYDEAGNVIDTQERSAKSNPTIQRKSTICPFSRA